MVNCVASCTLLKIIWGQSEMKMNWFPLACSRGPAFVTLKVDAVADVCINNTNKHVITDFSEERKKINKYIHNIFLIAFVII